MTSVEHPGLRSEIMNMATHMFVERGYHGLVMREVAEALNVTKPALYYYFKNKEALFLAILEAYLDEMEEVILRIQREGSNSQERIHKLVAHFLTQTVEKHALTRLASQEMGLLDEATRKTFRLLYKAKFLDRLDAIFQAGIDQHELRPIAPRTATWALLGILYPYFSPSHSQEKSDLTNIVETVTSIFWEGIVQR